MKKSFLWPIEVAREIGVTAATVRRYADQGPVPCLKDAKGRRRFRPEAIAVLKQRLGLNEKVG